MSDSGVRIEEATRRFLSHKVTRRQGLKLAGEAGLAVVGGTALLHTPHVHAELAQNASRVQERPLTLQVQTEEDQMRRDIEQKYGVILSIYSGDEYPPNPQFTKRWERSYLTYLDTVLSDLPAHFYAPDDQGRITNIELRGGTSSCCGFSDTERRLSLGYRVFSNLTYAGQDTSHEFTHMVGTYPILISEDDTMRQIHPQEALLDILGDPFPIVQPILQAQLRSKIAESRTRPGSLSIIEEVFLNNSMNHGLANDAEFIAVAGQEYFLKGKENFYKLYGLLFSEDQVDKLYNFTKAIYKGREYDRSIHERHPEIN